MTNKNKQSDLILDSDSKTTKNQSNKMVQKLKNVGKKIMAVQHIEKKNTHEDTTAWNGLKNWDLFYQICSTNTYVQ